MSIVEIKILGDAANDIKEGKIFYEKQSFGVGDYFRDTIVSDIQSLWIYAGVHIEVFGFYRLLSKKFPYAIYYRIDGDIATVVAVLDLRQNPKRIVSLLRNR